MSCLWNYKFGSECYCLDFSQNEKKPFIAAAFSDSSLKVWNLDDLSSGISSIDKPAFQTQSNNLGAADVKINHLGNRVAVSSIDYTI